MSEIPEDVRKAAREACDMLEGDDLYTATEEAVARAILAERQRCMAVCREVGEVHNDGYYNVLDLIHTAIADGRAPEDWAK